MHKVVVAFAFVVLCFVRAALAMQIEQDQVINSTAVHVVLDDQTRLATFSNSCGTQVLSQAQLQQGAIPDRIVPCPRPDSGARTPGTSSPPGPPAINSQRICSDRSTCPAGYICTGSRECVASNSPRICSDRSICPAGYICTGSRECVASNSPRICSDRSTCQAGYICTGSGQCIASNSPRICSDRSTCQAGYICTRDGTCLASNSLRVCADGSSYCPAGSNCMEDNKCSAGSSDEEISKLKNDSDFGDKSLSLDDYNAYPIPNVGYRTSNCDTDLEDSSASPTRGPIQYSCGLRVLASFNGGQIWKFSAIACRNGQLEDLARFKASGETDHMMMDMLRTASANEGVENSTKWRLRQVYHCIRLPDGPP
jgi:hypothetical protein